ncbi:MAG: hypothetical protein IPK58_16540 [Acidobacteria bacterium]|nr:hypothetical protein [Acidobacteriota bacterium]
MRNEPMPTKALKCPIETSSSISHFAASMIDNPIRTRFPILYPKNQR